MRACVGGGAWWRPQRWTRSSRFERQALRGVTHHSIASVFFLWLNKEKHVSEPLLVSFPDKYGRRFNTGTPSPFSPKNHPQLKKMSIPKVNMHVWWTKQEEFSDELDDLEEAAAEAAEREEKAKKQEGAGTEEAGGDDPDAEKKAAAEAARISAESMSPQRRLAAEKKKANAALSKEKKAR